MSLLGALALKQAARALPWYDAIWLRQYLAALKIIDRLRPALRPEFVASFARLRTPVDFKERKLDRVFDDATLEQLRTTIRSLPTGLHELHEMEKFGRIVVHDHPLCSDLQRKLVPLASELAGEAVEPSYNFLSLYRRLGVCQPHIDAPEAQWTLDVCLEQSDVWPIHFSEVVPWPEDASFEGSDWQDRIKHSPDWSFSSCALKPGEAVWFSGSSQWHYRDALNDVAPNGFCNLAFFHFLPAGMAEIAQPANWPRLFGLPALAAVVDPGVGA